MFLPTAENYFLAPKHQPNRILIHKPILIRLVIPEAVVMQPRFTVAILVLQAEGLVSSSGYVSFILQYVPTVIIAEPNQISFIIGHLTRDADLVAVEVVCFLAVFSFFGCPVVDLRQGVVRTEGFVRATVCLINLLNIPIKNT